MFNRAGTFCLPILRRIGPDSLPVSATAKSRPVLVPEVSTWDPDRPPAIRGHGIAKDGTLGRSNVIARMYPTLAVAISLVHIWAKELAQLAKPHDAAAEEAKTEVETKGQRGEGMCTSDEMHHPAL